MQKRDKDVLSTPAIATGAAAALTAAQLVDEPEPELPRPLDVDPLEQQMQALAREPEPDFDPGTVDDPFDAERTDLFAGQTEDPPADDTGLRIEVTPRPEFEQTDELFNQQRGML